MRKRFDEQLALLNVELVKMGSLCELVISDAIGLLFEGKRDLLRLTKETDDEIDEKEREIESLCLKLMLQQQPVARDLRIISSALKMITDLERIGDQARDIADIAQYVDPEDAKDHTHLREMAEVAANMVTKAIRSFVDKDLDLAHEVMQTDDTVDEDFSKMQGDLIEEIRNGEKKPQLLVDLLMIAKYLERIADHAVNVAEWVEFSITGVHISEELRNVHGTDGK
ncbi:MAG: phosphate signaling complex protein PhoU [Anaerovoracaceae bacterium]|jgi:phosphate transport system protein